jgi:hypothetical protein
LLEYKVTAAIHCRKGKISKPEDKPIYSDSWPSRSRKKNLEKLNLGVKTPFQKYETGIQPPQIAEIKAVIECTTQRQKNRGG